jgi:hypothetical protein
MVHKPFVKEMPTINVPVGMRQANWPGSVGQGSCVHASTISLFRWQGRLHTADYWRKTYGNGEWPEDLASKFDKEGIRYAYVTNGDAKFLEWCVRTRRGAAVTVMGGAHMVTLVHFDAKWAAILDNNNISKFKWMPRETFLAEWRASHGWAVTPIYTPAAPLPQ